MTEHPNHRFDEYIDDLAVDAQSADVITALAEREAATAPAGVRAGLLAAAAQRPRAGAAALAGSELYSLRSADLAALLDELDDRDWAMPAAPYDWTVHELVAHLVMVEEYTLRQLGAGDAPPVGGDDPESRDHLALGGSEIELLSSTSPAEAVGRWKRARSRILAFCDSPRFDSHASAPLHGWPFNAGDALIARAFEIWTHADDIRRATGRALSQPTAGELRTMSRSSVMSLPLLAAPGVTVAPTRIVLTGDGGGTYDLGSGETDRPASLLVADVVDYCRVAARRLDPDELASTREGDLDLLDALLAASQALAV